MKKSTIPSLALAGCVIGLLAGCTSTKVTSQERLVSDMLPKPNQIVVHDFGDERSEIAADSALARQASAPVTPPSAEQLALGRQLGSAIAAQLVAGIRKMGLPAVRASGATTLQPNDIVIRGYLVSIEKGSAAKRLTIGFGSGGSELTSTVEGYQMTANGLRRLGSGTGRAKGSRGAGAVFGVPGLLATGNPIGLVVGSGLNIYGEASGSSKVEGRAQQTAKKIADELKKRFREEGWIN